MTVAPAELVGGYLAGLNREQKLDLYVRLARQELTARRDGSRDIVARYRGRPYEFITRGLRELQGPTWRTWNAVVKAAFGVPLDDDELVLFREVAQRDPPGRRVKELWAVVGARGGKDSVASMLAVEGCYYGSDGVALRPGERAVVATFGTKLEQAGIVYNYARAYVERLPALRQRVISSLERGSTRPSPMWFDNDVELRTVVNNFTAPRGWAIARAFLDELAFWRDENSAIPDVEVLTAVERGMLSVPSGMIFGFSTPYRQAGLLYRKYKDYFGKDRDDVLVVQGATRTFNPSASEAVIQRALEEDYDKNSAEYLGLFRKDLADYVRREVVEALVAPGRYELPPTRGVRYYGFVDPSGGSSDSMTLAIAHKVPERNGRPEYAVLDCLREHRPPFSPDVVAMEFAQLLKSYGLNRVVGDAYGGEWPRERFRAHGVVYEVSEATKNEIYGEALPALNGGRCELLDHPRFVGQVCMLERRVARGGRDSIDHPPGQHDDVANAGLGAIYHALGGAGPAFPMFTSELVASLAGVRGPR